MRYSIYQTQQDRVPLDKEINYLKTYVELQMLRLKDQQAVQLELEEYEGPLQIAPMLLIPFVENAFKHVDRQAPAPVIFIDLGVDGERLFFKISNIYKKYDSTSGDPSSGIGMNNVKRRLDLMYPGRYDLVIQADEFMYTIILNMRLS